ncbi:TolC family protein [Pedobacter alluvionis]|uniref:Outer membrane protein TolC n=1 Tax=Pedobacter alluvionis TaxID=475253 RepID=A0A497XVC3_9SPHI|nr:TolC family protein [Pedobacter alluvionis]RLJ73526.1 outer membrane protein TolC [Pedobacter alluvionis]TFB32842.1 TolC family protein [Pedobacter alluvionis]
MIPRSIRLMLVASLIPAALFAQSSKELNINQAIELGIANSKNLKLSQNKIDQAVAKLEVVKDNALPTGNASFIYNHAEIPTTTFTLPGSESSLRLPKRADAFVGTAAVQELVYGGGKLKYAKESTRLLAEVARLDADKSKEEITYAVINTYYSLYKVLQSRKVVDQNLESIAAQIKQAQRFFEQGIVTKNDVLRFQLQQANVTLTQMDIESNRKVINYNLDILLGLPEDTEVKIVDPTLGLKTPGSLNEYIGQAFANRQELKQLDIQNKVADFNIKTIKANTLPTVGVGANLYYINPSGNFIPPANQYLMPITLGATVSWNFGNLWTNKNKVSQAKIEQSEITLQKDILSDQVKTDINKNFQNYQVAMNKIQVLETSIAQATENDKLLASKYKNNVASVTDRIDAETLLYQAKINLEIAKADAGLAYYTLLKSTGKITQ